MLQIELKATERKKKVKADSKAKGNAAIRTNASKWNQSKYAIRISPCVVLSVECGILSQHIDQKLHEFIQHLNPPELSSGKWSSLFPVLHVTGRS